MIHLENWKNVTSFAALLLALVLNAPSLSAQSSKSKIPVGTTIVVRNDAEISSRTAKTGQRWYGTLVGVFLLVARPWQKMAPW